MSENNSEEFKITKLPHLEDIIKFGEQMPTSKSSLINKLNKEITLIIGAGEIGISLNNVLSKVYETYVRDIQEELRLEGKKFKVINICFPYSDSFIESVKKYMDLYDPELVIIHSTVPPGTTRSLGSKVVHSPVNGKHPNLEQSLLTFVKFLGGTDVFKIFEAVGYLSDAGMKTYVFSSPEATELAKILCTTQYGWQLMIMKEIARICNENNVPFHEVYTQWNNHYNEGYRQMNMPQFTRPILFPVSGEIGGHCVIPNTNLYKDFFTDTLKGRNESYKGKAHENNRRKNKDMAS